ncbi:SDR family oxidoreductase [Microbacterium sp. HD4P20]|uniref:SDR family oxidoreductase n=1 Tax=Microbacterium sp. HD4P20 TaxID=2864874 RepID=UPI001C63F8A2|nr:SDR family oxidoreductase [Microbacterium sp. HD4P20]MCP2638520.1 SDR family oxidoreductase [Microbacterium sp. HD4P20]
MSSSTSLPLRGKTALITGVSRRRGIGFAVASQLAHLGADIFIHHYRAHDVDLPWGADDLDAVRDGLRAALTPGASFGDVSADLRDAASLPALIESAKALTGRLDILVCNHAKSGDDGSILDMTADRLDGFWQANARSTLLLTREFAALHAGAGPGARPGERIGRRGPFAEPTGRVFWMTSGQIHGPMRGEVAYAASKSVLAGLTKTVAAELLDLGIILNTIDPGPVNTGYLDPETTDRPLEELEAWMRATPFGRYGEPADPARLIAWLATPDGAWVVGQVLSTDGGLGLG